GADGGGGGGWRGWGGGPGRWGGGERQGQGDGQHGTVLPRAPGGSPLGSSEPDVDSWTQRARDWWLLAGGPCRGDVADGPRAGPPMFDVVRGRSRALTRLRPALVVSLFAHAVLLSGALLLSRPEPPPPR